MRYFLHFSLLIFYVTSIKCSIYSDLRGNVLNFLKGTVVAENDKLSDDKTNVKNLIGMILRNNEDVQREAKDITDMKLAKDKANVLAKARTFERDLNDFENVLPAKIGEDKQHYHMDPVLNKVRRNSKDKVERRKYETDSDSYESSSSLEVPKWKDEWRVQWMKKKLEAVNMTKPKGDVVNMIAARPWGVPCGDPNQHDMPWGSCMLPSECEAEYRIYRGDHFCGRTQFVCCAIQLHTYDMYQGMDVSFGSSMATDSEEKKNKHRNSKERKRRRRQREKRKRRRNRLRRKRKIKRNIRKIVREIKKILNRSYRNGTTARKRKTKELKKFIKDLKKKYKKDRKTVKDIHEMEIIKIDEALQAKLNHVQDVNRNFLSNSTFRDIVLNGTITKKGARMLVQAYPELANYVNIDTRRSGNLEEPEKLNDYLDYDIEYGLLYY